jgi:hypothetical protein
VGLTIGPQAALRFFVRPKNYKGSAFFLGGVLLVVWGWTFVGARRGWVLLWNGITLSVAWKLQRGLRSSGRSGPSWHCFQCPAIASAHA